MIHRIYFYIGANVRCWFITVFKIFLTSLGFFEILVFNLLRIFPVLGSSGFAFSRFSLCSNFSWLYLAFNCPLWLRVPWFCRVWPLPYLYSPITYRQYTDTEMILYIWGVLSSSLTLSAKIADLSDAVIFDLETVREDAIFIIINVNNNNNTNDESLLIKAENDTSGYILYCFCRANKSWTQFICV